MKIAQLFPYPMEYENQIPELPNGATQGGGETSSFRFSQVLASRGHDITYFTGKYKGISLDRIDINDHFRIIYLNLFFKNMGPAFSVKLFFKLLFEKYDVIHCHQIPIMFSLIGALAAKLSGKKFIMTFHGRVPFCILDKSVGYIASLLSDGVTVQNKYAFDLVSKFCVKSKLSVIPHGVDIEMFFKKENPKNNFSFSKNKFKIIFVGRLIKAKGIDVLLNAIQQSKNKNFIELLIVGEGPEKNYLIKLAKELGLKNNVKFLGLLSQENLPDAYSISDLLVLPSTNHDKDGNLIRNVSENFGLVLAEAMACEVPVIASKFGGIPFWIEHKRNGLLFHERNCIELASLIDLVITDHQLRKDLIKNAMSDIYNKYCWQAVASKFEKLYLS
jgi:glycosyltransferase involved in cell wall biosynthesis